MNTSYLCNDWNEFEKLFPDAYAWMIACSLRREKEVLTAEANRIHDYLRTIPSKFLYLASRDECKRLDWIKERLADLNDLDL